MQDSGIQTPAELESRKKSPVVEVKLSDEAIKTGAGFQSRQDLEAYEALNRKR